MTTIKHGKIKCYKNIILRNLAKAQNKLSLVANILRVFGILCKDLECTAEFGRVEVHSGGQILAKVSQAWAGSPDKRYHTWAMLFITIAVTVIITIIVTITNAVTDIIIIIIITRPKPAYGRQGLAGSWGQDTDEVSTFLVFFTSHFAPAALSSDLNQPETINDDKNTPGIIKTRP